MNYVLRTLVCFFHLSLLIYCISSEITTSMVHICLALWVPSCQTLHSLMFCRRPEFKTLFLQKYVFLVVSVISLRRIREMEVYIIWGRVSLNKVRSETEDVRKYLHNSSLCNYSLRLNYNKLPVAGYHLVLAAEFCLVFFLCVYTHTQMRMLSCIKPHHKTVVSAHLLKMEVNEKHLEFQFYPRFFDSH